MYTSQGTEATSLITALTSIDPEINLRLARLALVPKVRSILSFTHNNPNNASASAPSNPNNTSTNSAASSVAGGSTHHSTSNNNQNNSNTNTASGISLRDPFQSPTPQRESPAPGPLHNNNLLAFSKSDHGGMVATSAASHGAYSHTVTQHQQQQLQQRGAHSANGAYPDPRLSTYPDPRFAPTTAQANFHTPLSRLGGPATSGGSTISGVGGTSISGAGGASEPSMADVIQDLAQGYESASMHARSQQAVRASPLVRSAASSRQTSHSGAARFDATVPSFVSGARSRSDQLYNVYTRPITWQSTNACMCVVTRATQRMPHLPVVGTGLLAGCQCCWATAVQ